MKLNIAYPRLGTQKVFEIEDMHKYAPFMLKNMGAIVPADSLGAEWKGYQLRITGGNDKQGFPMMQGVMTTNRVRLLLNKNHKCMRERRAGERKRKSVRGCTTDNNLSVIAMVIEQKGENDIEGLTDQTRPRQLGPKRADNIRKLFQLSKKDDVRKYVVRKVLKATEKYPKEKSKAPKIQRLVTPITLQRRRRLAAAKKQRKEKLVTEREEYNKLLAQRHKEARDRKRSKSHSMRESKNK